jgi:hypothetical protein
MKLRYALLTVANIALAGCASTPNDSVLWPYVAKQRDGVIHSYPNVIRSYPDAIRTYRVESHSQDAETQQQESKSGASLLAKPVETAKPADKVAVPAKPAKRHGRLERVEIIAEASSTKPAAKNSEAEPVTVDLRKDRK